MILSSKLQDSNILSQYFKDIEKYKPLTANEERSLAPLIRKGDANALKKLINANLRFVITVSMNYINQGMSLSDIINEGNIGLMNAALRFDEKKNFKFISYAVWWIRQSILQALAKQSRLYTVPLNKVATIHKISRAQQKLEQKLHRLPAKDEIATECNLNQREVFKTMDIDKQKLSIDGSMNIGYDSTMLRDVIKNTKSESPDKRVTEGSSHEALMEIINSLKYRERVIISLYFGLSGDEPLTLYEIGRKLNITRERVRQIKDRTLKHLKTRKLKNLLKEYYS